jgi:hypothetical protein
MSEVLYELSIAEILIACSSQTINIGKMLRDLHSGLPQDVFSNSLIDDLDKPNSDISFMNGIKGAYENMQDLFEIDERTSLIVPLKNIVIVQHLESQEILPGFFEINGGVQIGPKADASWPDIPSRS